MSRGCYFGSKNLNECATFKGHPKIKHSVLPCIINSFPLLCQSVKKLVQLRWKAQQQCFFPEFMTYSVATVGGGGTKLFSASLILTVFRCLQPEVGSSWSDFRVLLSSSSVSTTGLLMFLLSHVCLFVMCGHYPGAFQKSSSVNKHSSCLFLFWGGVLNPVDSTGPLLTSLQLWQISSLCFPHLRLALGDLRDCFSTQPESPLQPVCPDLYSLRGAQVTLQAKKSHIYFSPTWRTLTATVKSKTVV